MKRWPIFCIILILLYFSVNICNAVESGWICKESASKMGDTSSFTCTNSSVDTQPNAIGRQQHGSFFIAGFKQNGYCQKIVYVGWPSYLGQNTKDVDIKYDDYPIFTEKWKVTDDGKFAASPNPDILINELKDRNQILIRLSPYHRGPEELEFNITGVNDIINNIEEFCR